MDIEVELGIQKIVKYNMQTKLIFTGGNQEKTNLILYGAREYHVQVVEVMSVSFCF